jgi:hypothetical protein
MAGFLGFIGLGDLGQKPGESFDDDLFLLRVQLVPDTQQALCAYDDETPAPW